MTGFRKPTAIRAGILAGGQGRRMGMPKALLRVGESSLLAAVTQQLYPRCPEVLLSVKGGADESYPGGESCIVVEDACMEQTPIAGIVSLLEQCRDGEQLLITCCDVICDPPELLDILLAHPGKSRVLRVQGQLMPFPGVYHRDTLPMWKEAIASGELRVCSLVRRIHNIEIVDLPSASFGYRVHNINSAEELEIYRRTASRGMR